MTNVREKKATPLAIGLAIAIAVLFFGGAIVWGAIQASRQAQVASSSSSEAPPETRHIKAPASVLQERVNSFAKLIGDSRDATSHFFGGVEQLDYQLTFYVTDRWTSLSRDNQEACIRHWFTLWGAMGGPRQIQEKADNYTIKIRHQGSNRVLATWDSFRGFTLKD